MRKWILKTSNSTLVKASFWNGVASFITIFSSLVSSKITAVYLGPAGVALLGQFMNAASMAMSIAAPGINCGVIKYTAENFDNPKSRSDLISTGFVITLWGSVIVTICIIFSRTYLSNKFFHTDKYALIFGILGGTIILFTLNAFLLSILSGYKEFKKVAIINMLGSIVSLLVSIILTVRFGVCGAFLGYILSQILIFFITLLFVIKSACFKLANFCSGPDFNSLKKLLHFSLMSFTTIFAVAFIQFQIRNYLIQNLSIEQAGYWQGIIRISDLYLAFITMTLSVYYLPQLSELNKREDLRKEIFKGYAFILPLAAGSAVIIFILREWIIQTLLTKSFLPMMPLFLMQLTGDVFKIAAWLLAYLVVAKAMTKVFIITELFFGISLYILTIVFVSQMGVVGATYAYALNCLFCLLVMVFIFRNILFSRGTSKNLNF